MSSTIKRNVIFEKMQKINLKRSYIKIPPLPVGTMITTQYYVLCGVERFFDGSKLNEIVASNGGWVTHGGTKKFTKNHIHKSIQNKIFIPFEYEDRMATDNPYLIEKELLESIMINGNHFKNNK